MTRSPAERGRSRGLGRLVARLWRHFSKRRRRQLVLLVCLMIGSAFAEVASLGALLPFLGALTSPGWIFQQPGTARLAHALGAQTAREVVLPLTIVFVVAALLASGLRIFLLYASTRLAFASASDLSIDVYRRTLYQPYTVHVARNSSQVISGITNKVGGAANVMYNGLLLVSAVVSLIAVTMALVVINWVVALVSIAVFGSGYVLVTLLTRKRLFSNSQRIAREQIHVVKALREGLGGIRDVLLDGSQPVYCDVYRRADQPLRRADGNNNFIGGCPRFVMEAVGMALIAALAYGLSRQSGGLAASIPALGALALGAQRLLPALQQAYTAWASMAGNEASLLDALELLEQPLPSLIETPGAQAPHLVLREAIRFNCVRFRYANSAPWILDGFDLTIPQGARIGLVGATGSGKSTALDLLMGLLTPTEGKLLVDGVCLTGSDVRAWQRTIAHVPQAIFLADASIKDNIAFGVPSGSIDMARVREAAERAQIASFIESSQGGYDAMVGERGIRLSGGQRQRIGIARALYKQASVLVFDEATSALDNATERMVMDSIESFDRQLTVLLIAHRLDSVRRCDTIVEIDHGRVVAQGTYEQLLQRSPSFRRIAQSGAVTS